MHGPEARGQGNFTLSCSRLVQHVHIFSWGEGIRPSLLDGQVWGPFGFVFTKYCCVGRSLSAGLLFRLMATSAGQKLWRTSVEIWWIREWWCHGWKKQVLRVSALLAQDILLGWLCEELALVGGQGLDFISFAKFVRNPMSVRLYRRWQRDEIEGSNGLNLAAKKNIPSNSNLLLPIE